MSDRAPFEQTALKITGYAFYILSVGLILGAVNNVWQHNKTEGTLAGTIISCISILVMWYVLQRQTSIGEELHSAPIISDAQCTRVCIYMSVTLLLSSLIYKLTGFAYADSIGTIALTYFCVMEGREALQKAAGKECEHHR